MDDEYKWAGVEDPKVMVTTSRDPSSRLKMFAKVGFFEAFVTCIQLLHTITEKIILQLLEILIVLVV